jgi:hypothetical protein
MSFKRKINRLSQFPTSRGHNAHKLKEILLKMSVDAERSPEMAEQYKAILSEFMSQYEETKPVAKKKAPSKAQSEDKADKE